MARGLVLWGLCLCCAQVGAQQAALDPTRPPTVLQAPDGAAVPSGPTLQVIRTVAGVRTAVISGQEVKVGSHFSDQRVLRIDEDQVVLSGSPPQILKLFPGVAKTSRTVEPAPAKRRGEKAKRKEAP